tara:strand:- start:9740 stop:9892 length:153 start_codon:yes stop_codon:yes gene_type:complete
MKVYTISFGKLGNHQNIVFDKYLETLNKTKPTKKKTKKESKKSDEPHLFI